MLENRRKFIRHHVPFRLRFRPTYGAIDFSMADTVNLSCDGIGLDAHDFRFILYENLEIIMDLPENGGSVALSGYIAWKKQNGRRCLAGIKFRMKDKKMQRDAIGRVFSYMNIPAEAVCEDTLFKMPQEPPCKLGFVKMYNEKRTMCKVTFRLLREVAGNARDVAIVGDFNHWEASGSRMTHLENGDFVITLELESNREYRFKYLIDGHRWENDWYADKYVRNNSGTKDSVVVV